MKMMELKGTVIEVGAREERHPLGVPTSSVVIKTPVSGEFEILCNEEACQKFGAYLYQKDAVTITVEVAE